MSNINAAAVIGLGSMGYGAALSLLRAGFSVHGVDVREDVLTRFAGEGGKAFKTPAEAMPGVTIVFVFVVNAAQAETVLFGDGGAVAAAGPRTLFLLCPTMPPSTTVEIAGRLAAAGMQVLDAPVSGGSAKALSGEMTVMASGSPEAFDIAGPALDAVASKVFRLGDRPGEGSKVKMINQLLAGVHIAATAEALTLAASEGLDVAQVYDVISVSAGNSWMFGNRGRHIVDGDYTPHSAVDIFVKDMGIVTSEAAGAGASVPLSETALALFKEASAAGLGRMDDAAVAMVLARRAGIRLPGMEEE
jgi:L-threonate 2-dehydrogenase